MKAICVDDERLLMEEVLDMLNEMPQIASAAGFTRSKEAVAYVKENAVDIAFLDINMPDMNGLDLAVELKSIIPDIAIVFLTGYAQYAVDAFKTRATGYLLKPVNETELQKEVEYALSAKIQTPSARLTAKTFGGFDLFVDGEMMVFKTSKAKELLAYLIDRKGSSVTRSEAFSIIYEDRQYDRSMQKQFDVIIRSLRTTLKEYDVEEIFDLKSGTMRIRPELIDCDAYRFFSGDRNAINEFRGEYMNAYAWSDITEGFMTRKIEEGR